MFDANTKVNDILTQYPFVKDEIIKRVPEAKMIDTLIGKALLKNATISDVASKFGKTPEKLIAELQSIIDAHK
ncbi:MAG: hypothetical protein IJJ38_00020 [Lachnospiraceae bacterium]|nr:hypothetical protein [Lachnospiraceae bacterium]